MADLSDEEYAKRILERADKIVESVDGAFIIKQRGHSLRAMPTFRPEEITLGPELGHGGFGVVNEIIKFTLDEDDVDTSKENKDNSQDVDGSKENKPNSQDPAEKNGNDGDGVLDEKALVEISDSGNQRTENGKSIVFSGKDEDWDKEKDLPSLVDNHDFHYDITKARHVMSSRVFRNGKGRYALKRLHEDLTTLEKARGMVDLAVEAKYLSVVWHPNIIKMRGMASGPMIDNYFFIILDRLVDTLDKRMNRWAKDFKTFNNGLMCGLFKNQKGLDGLILESMTVAYDLAAAFFYLHENRLVYRDVKPENVGFDFRGDVKVFDFGLCKDLRPQLKARDGGYGYRLTGRAGSLPYMAPEVAKMRTYDTKCDCFSFAIMLWEMLACKPAFEDYTSLQFMDKVVTDQERMDISKSWPPLTRLMIPEAWDDDPRKRPDMKRIAILLRSDLNDLTTDERILHRTRHLASRSQHSFNEDLNEEVSESGKKKL